MLSGCGSAPKDGGYECTVRAIGEETGADSIRATLNVPDEYISGAEISNGGIVVEWDDCDFPLNAFLSYETATHIIETAPTRTLTNSELGDRLVDAELFIWRFTDGANEPRFFVMAVSGMKPVTEPRNSREAERFKMPGLPVGIR